MIKTKEVKKWVLILLSLMLVLLSVGPAVSAASLSKDDTNQEVVQLEKALQFLMEKAAIYDSENNVIGFHFDKLEDEFGEVEEFKVLEREIEYSSCELVETTTKATSH